MNIIEDKMKNEILEKLKEVIWEKLIGKDNQKLKRSVSRRVIEKIALYILESRLSSLGPIHKGAFNITYFLEKIPLVFTKTVLEEICKTLFYGLVIPVQRVKEVVINSKAASLGRCICRYSGKVQDLYSPYKNKIYMALEGKEANLYLDKMIDKYIKLKENDTETCKDLKKIFDKFVCCRENNDKYYSMENFWKETFPFWEILINHEDYTPAWKNSLTANNHALEINRDLLCEWVDAIYYTRGVIFTSMSLVDAKYTICSCPGPENDGGCILFNWHFYSGNEPVVIHNSNDCFGQRRDKFGNPLPCNKYKERASLYCLGCGCKHNLQD